MKYLVLRHPCPSAKFYGLPSWLSAFPFFWLMQTATVPGMLNGEGQAQNAAVDRSRPSERTLR